MANPVEGVISPTTHQSNVFPGENGKIVRDFPTGEGLWDLYTYCNRIKDGQKDGRTNRQTDRYIGAL